MNATILIKNNLLDKQNTTKYLLHHITAKNVGLYKVPACQVVVVSVSVISSEDKSNLKSDVNSLKIYQHSFPQIDCVLAVEQSLRTLLEPTILLGLAGNHVLFRGDPFWFYLLNTRIYPLRIKSLAIYHYRLIIIVIVLKIV